MMYNTRKKALYSLAAAFVVSLSAAGFMALDAPLQTNAEDAMMSVNTLGELSWTKTDGATGYKWSYTTGNYVSGEFGSEDNSVNVGEAIMRAAKEATGETASVTFTVTPVGVAGAAQTYTYNFMQYIDMGYTTSDYGDVRASEEENGVKTLPIASWRYKQSAAYKNNLLTFGLYSETGFFNKGYNKLYLEFFNNQANQPLYAVEVFNGRCYLVYGDGWSYSSGWGVGTGTRIKVTQANKGEGYVIDDEASYNGTLTVGYSHGGMQNGVTYYNSFGVFDTYDISGDKIGETVYYNRDYVDVTTGDMVSQESWTKFLTTAELTAAGFDDESYNETYIRNSSYAKLGTLMADAKFNRAMMGVSIIVPATAYPDLYMFSGKLADAPEKLYYDNVDASLNWNKVEGADGYEWTYGNNPWMKTVKTSANVASVITAAREAYATTGVDYIRFKVRAVKDGVAGAESELTLDISVMQKTRSTLKDFADINWQWLSNGKATTGTGSNPDDMWYDSSYQNGVGWLYGDNSATYQVGQYFTFSFRMDTHRNAGFAAPVFATSLMSQKDKLGYWLTVWEDGTVGLNRGKDWNGVNSNSSFKLGSLLYECPQLLPAIEEDVKYFVTFGIDEVYDLEGTKVTDRIIVRISKEVGLDREMLGVMEYDALDEIAFPTNYITYAQFWLNAQDTATGTSRTVVGSSMNKSYSYNVSFQTPDGEASSLETEVLNYGEKFDLADKLAVKVLDGYKITGWKYEVDGSWVDFSVTEGYWNIKEDVILKATGELVCEKQGLSLTLDDKIGVNLYASVADGVDVTGAKMKLTYKGNSTEVALADSAITEGAYAGCYKFSYYVPAKEIYETITAQLVLADGTLGKEITYSVATYLTLAETEGSEKVKALATALAKYGDAAATYFDVNAEDPEADTTEVDFSSYAPTVNDVEDDGEVLYGISLLVEDATTIRLYFRLQDGVQMPTITVDGETLEAVADGAEGFYYVDKTGISARELATDITFVIGNSTVTCNALSYGYLTNGSENVKLVNLVKALYAYSETTKAYWAD